jgi:hypothetical protein
VDEIYLAFVGFLGLLGDSELVDVTVNVVTEKPAASHEYQNEYHQNKIRDHKQVVSGD